MIRKQIIFPFTAQTQNILQNDIRSIDWLDAVPLKCSTYERCDYHRMFYCSVA